jgi:hypothetical protein
MWKNGDSASGYQFFVTPAIAAKVAANVRSEYRRTLIGFLRTQGTNGTTSV